MVGRVSRRSIVIYDSTRYSHEGMLTILPVGFTSNAFVYSGSRVLYSMALNGQAPWVFKYTTKRGVPWAAVLFTWAFGLLAFLNVSNSGAQVFQWFSSE